MRMRKAITREERSLESNRLALLLIAAGKFSPKKSGPDIDSGKLSKTS